MKRKAPPLASKSIFSIDLGPYVVRMTFATTYKNKLEHQYNRSLKSILTSRAYTYQNFRALPIAPMPFTQEISLVNLSSKGWRAPTNNLLSHSWSQP